MQPRPWVAEPSQPILRTARLVLEPLVAEHAAEMVGVLSCPTLYAVTGGSPPSLVELTARYVRQVAGPDHPGERWCNWVLREGSALVGYVQATVSISDTAAVAWLVRPQDQGRGLASEAAAAMVAHLQAVGVGAVTAWIADTHPASLAVARRLGLAPSEQLDEDGERLWR